MRPMRRAWSRKEGLGDMGTPPTLALVRAQVQVQNAFSTQLAGEKIENCHSDLNCNLITL